MSDHANNAAATGAGWVRTQIDRGAGRSPRYITRYEKQADTTGAPAAQSHEGHSDVDQATADTLALNALNGARRLRYGAGSTAGTDSRGKTRSFDA